MIASFENSFWIDGLQRQIRVRQKAFLGIIEYCGKKENHLDVNKNKDP